MCKCKNVIMMIITMLPVAFVHADDTYWKPNPSHNEVSIDFSLLQRMFPNGIVRNVPPTFPLVDIGGSFKYPSCQNPGFQFDLHATIASISQIQAFFLSEAQSVIRAAPLLIVMQTVPELADIQKFLADLSLLKLDLQHSSCQEIVSHFTNSGLIPPQRHYADCVQVEIDAGKSRDDAERNCSSTIRDVYNFLSKGYSKKINLWSSAFSFIKSKRDQSGQRNVPDDKALAKLQSVAGEIEVGQEGTHLTTGTPLDELIVKEIKEIQSAMISLVNQCRADMNAKGNVRRQCDISQTDIKSYEASLAITYKNSTEPYWFIDVYTIESLAKMDELSAVRWIQNFAQKLALYKTELLLNDLSWVRNFLGSQEGSKDHIDKYDMRISQLKDEYKSIKMQYQEHNELQQMKMFPHQVGKQIDDSLQRTGSGGNRRNPILSP